MGPEDKLESAEQDGESSERKLEPGEALEAAMREASEALESREQAQEQPEGAAPDSATTADKMTIEVLSGELQDLKTRYEAMAEENQELRDRHLRLQAEFENFRRRGLRERQEFQQYGNQNLVKDLLSAVDNLERAVEHSEDSAGGDLQSLLQGVDLVLQGNGGSAVPVSMG